MSASELRLDLLFHALSDATRRALISRLVAGEMSASQLSENHNMSLAAILKHIHILESAGIVDTHKKGRTRYAKLNIEAFGLAQNWLELFDNNALASLDALIELQILEIDVLNEI